MRRGAAAPVFQIGFPDTGEDWLAASFLASGHRVRLRDGGALAEDILLARAEGRRPLDRWPGARLFAGLDADPALPGPALEAFRAFDFLDAQFPDATFVLTLRDPDEWVSLRFHADGGLVRERAALRLGVAEADLPALWHRDWEDHLAAVTAYFGDDPRLVRLMVDGQRPEEMAEALAHRITLDRLAPLSLWPEGQSRIKARARMRERLMSPWAQRVATGQGADAELVDALTRHALGRRVHGRGHWPKPHRSQVFASWDGAGAVFDRRDEPLPLGRLGAAGPFLRHGPGRPKLERITGTLNDLIAAGARAPALIDMEDARFFGAEGQPTPPEPLIAYNRRPEGRNIVLWPLYGYHSPGGRFYVSEEPRDEIAFDDKQDRLVWRGNLSGRSPAGRPARKIYDEIAASAPDSPDRAALIAELAAIPRAAAVRRLGRDGDYDVAITPGGQHDMLRDLADFAGQIDSPRSPGWFYHHRYILSLAGNDTGSNFLMAANSNSLVFKEEDGWELFYTDLFKPWEHYVPLAPGIGDVAEKLDWARSHPAEARAIAAAARALCARLAGPDTRAAWLRAMVEELALPAP